jgi:hypothetical protein
MRSYVIATGVVFGLLTLAHIWRLFVEPQLATDPSFILITLVAASLSVAAWFVTRRAP